ncbi:hypothetical protein [Methylibium petroleiphilum]|uniref:Uncharacterized protein n=1 Tax=Methylibium petroleiphilum (strain ATCC BAA-1232 / LMG 22953 / PM1) TaxID=420662 RepID=A2SNJ1_METPP|nr:hypothetical protein [Methylibium petroleiphilum]ABM97130.1 hypothetical protein Mpe_B0355 [Methylibium petroleiphilum PM1]
MPDEIWRLAVGEPFAPGVTYGGVDRFEYRYTNGTHLLQFVLGKLTEREIQAFQHGAIHVGLYTRGDSLFFLFKVAGLYDWSDQAFSINALPPDAREIPQPQPGAGKILLTMVLVDSDTGLVRALRAVTYSTHMSELFERMLRRQVANGLTAEQHQRNVEATYREFPNSRDLVRNALVTERAGITQPGEGGRR